MRSSRRVMFPRPAPSVRPCFIPDEASSNLLCSGQMYLRLLLVPTCTPCPPDPAPPVPRLRPAPRARFRAICPRLSTL
jgi:hypothetical protein